MPGADVQQRDRRASSPKLLFASVAVLAFVVRLTPLLIGGGLRSYGRYDDGVYYAGADALTFGRVPYRDFVLLHPPGILLVLAPFALLGRLTSDPIGMAAGRLAFMSIGALNAVLVCALARRWNWRAGIAAGILYACWYPAVFSEQSTLLEPLGSTALLVALLLLLKTARPPTARAELLAGVALGLAETLKIWYVAPWAVIVLWLLLSRRARSALRVALSGAAALVLVLLPFILLARGRMYDMVVRDQLLRSPEATSRLVRLRNILGIESFVAGHHTALNVVTVIALVVLAAAAVACSIDPSARLLVMLLAGNLLVLLASPSYFTHYAALTAAPIALVLGVGLGKLPATTEIWRPGTAILTLALLAFIASGIRIATEPEGKPFPGAAFARAAPAGCVAADDPQALIQMNRLSRDLRSGCRVAIDVSGITYDAFDETIGGVPVERGDNFRFQRYLFDYLMSGRSFVIARKIGDGLPPDRLREIAKQRVLARKDHLGLWLGGGRP
jgi:alpha-1,2-mannosyltransferase